VRLGQLPAPKNGVCEKIGDVSEVARSVCGSLILLLLEVAFDPSTVEEGDSEVGRV
jgi:hypothetical protein